MGAILNKEIIELNVPLLKEEFLEYLSATKLFLLSKHPYWASVFLGCKVILVGDVEKDKRVPAPAYTDGWRIFIDDVFMGNYLQWHQTKFGAGQNPKIHKARVFAFILMHEVLHCALMHVGRLSTKEPLLWNIATDSVINENLKLLLGIHPQALVSKDALSDTVPEFKKVTESEFLEKFSSEKVYEMLYRKAKEKGWMKEGGKMVAPGNVKDPGDLVKGQGQGQEKASSGSDHFQGNPSDQDLERHWKEILSQNKEMCRHAGKLPGGMQEDIDSIFEPIVDWRNALRNLFIDSVAGRSDFEWTRPSKRSESIGCYMPSVRSKEAVIGVIIDTSGSITKNEFSRFISEVFAIANMANVQIRLIMVDTEVAYSEMIEEEQDIPHKIYGRGGTLFLPGMKEIEKRISDEGERITAVIYFTDGYNGDEQAMRGYSPEFQLMWMITTDVKLPYEGIQVPYRISQ